MTRVFIAGGFDPIHAGHIDHIIKARSLGDELLVILQNDENLINKKGYCLLPYDDRYAVLTAIKYVNKVAENIDKDGTCAKTIEYIMSSNVKLDIFAKGGDRTPENMPQNELDICKRLGIRIVYGCGDLINSSSELVAKLTGKLGMGPRM
jgi:D-beta-D-heptose 7-phosphate kinase/D-beta-D-heptose 1-phosphate adenosyltransferase